MPTNPSLTSHRTAHFDNTYPADNPFLKCLAVLSASYCSAWDSPQAPRVLGPDTLNPIHLSFATKAYKIQSQTLHIPDRYGWFSPGPPRLQVHQALVFRWVAVCLTIQLFFAATIIIFMASIPSRLPVGRIALVLTLLFSGTVALIWAVECSSEKRAKDYVWEDWKLRKE